MRRRLFIACDPRESLRSSTVFTRHATETLWRKEHGKEIDQANNCVRYSATADIVHEATFVAPSMKYQVGRRPVSQLYESYLEISRYFRTSGFVTFTDSSSIRHHCSLSFLEPCEHQSSSDRASTSLLASGQSSRFSSWHLSSRPVARSTERRFCGKKINPQVRKISTATKATDTASIIDSFQEISHESPAAAGNWFLLESYDVASTAGESPSSKPLNLHGYVVGHRTGNQVDFLTIADPQLQRAIQVVCPKSVRLNAITAKGSDTKADEGEGSNSIRHHTPVMVTGVLVKSPKPPAGLQSGSNTFLVDNDWVGRLNRIGHIELQAESLKILNEFPSTLVAKRDTNFGPEKRHLQFRTDAYLRESIQLRSKVKAACANYLLDKGFTDIETPLLFKSTPEGAREFVVPTRRKGLAYALPQSPQQYKQVLMASGIPRYFQFARCFRDEDLRADRQPEFTQLDLEMAFATREIIMGVIEGLILDVIWPVAGRTVRLPPPLISKLDDTANSVYVEGQNRLPVYTYDEVMSRYGSDKPDPRLGAEITRIDTWVPQSLKRMLTDIEDPIVEVFQMTTKHQDPQKSKQFMTTFMDLPSTIAQAKTQFGMAGISIYDPAMPLRGLAAFGHEAADQVEEMFEPEEGDIFVVQVRPNAMLTGGSTKLGDMRRSLLQYALEQDLVDKPLHDSMFWVVDFPLFSPTEEGAPGQEGQAGICSTHHPFTAPRAGQDLTKILTDPLSVIGDHYDLVVNGTEIGGGSRRIHQPKMQELIFREVLRMQPERIADFSHLLNALEAGCPPHAGIALGFDRLMALLRDKPSVRDVIAFPKWADGEDKFVGSPSQLSPEQLSTYHLKVVDSVDRKTEPTISLKA